MATKTLTKCAGCEENFYHLRDALADVRRWLEWKLDSAAVHVPGTQSPSGHPHGWCAIQIPDWDVKQKIAAIAEVLGRENHDVPR